MTLRHYIKAKKVDIYNLGLQEMKEKGSARYKQSSIRKKLDHYSLDLEKHIVASTHDGAAVMRKYGADILKT